ncbi:MAG: hypothetical protein ABID87_01390 [Chloroflexota bacterium]
MNTPRQLYELQELDLEIAAQEKQRQEMQARVGDRRELDAARNRLEKAAAGLAELKKQQRSQENESKDLATKIAEVEKRLYGGKINNPKELSSLQQEDNLLRQRHDQQETAALELLERAEAEETALAKGEGEYREMERGWQERQQRLTAELKETEAKLEKLKEQRAGTAAVVDPATLEFYENLRQNKGEAVAQVAQGICRACRISLSSSQIQQVRGGVLAHCNSCGRILFLP